MFPTSREAPFIMLPPSEGKAIGGRRAPQTGSFARSLGGHRREVVSALGAVLSSTPTEPELSKIFSVRGDLLSRAIMTTEQMVAGRPLVMPAWQRYTGVVWDHLSPEDLSVEIRERILVPSGLLGVTTAEDPIADYRLKMSVRLADLGTLHSYWREPVSRALAKRCRGGVIVDLLPQEHAAAIDVATLRTSANVVVIRFVSTNGSQAAGHAAKAVKGIVARSILTNGLDVMKRFRWEGWSTRETDDGFDVITPS